MKALITQSLKGLIRRLGYELVPADVAARQAGEFSADFEREEMEDRSVAPFTLTGPIRLIELIRAVRYLVNHGIPGDIVECGFLERRQHDGRRQNAAPQAFDGPALLLSGM